MNQNYQIERCFNVLQLLSTVTAELDDAKAYTRQGEHLLRLSTRLIGIVRMLDGTVQQFREI